MNTTKTIAALFDFDGVIMDTETQYTVFWDEQGRKYLNEEDFGRRIKGQTLLQIYEKYFSDQPEAQLEISAELYVYEQKMSYEYIPGVEAFIADLRRNGAKIAVVTSSNEEKMANVYNAHPEFKDGVCLCFTKTDEGSLGDTLCHRSFADDKDVFCDYLVPYPLFVFNA